MEKEVREVVDSKQALLRVPNSSKEITLTFAPESMRKVRTIPSILKLTRIGGLKYSLEATEFMH